MKKLEGESVFSHIFQVTSLDLQLLFDQASCYINLYVILFLIQMEKSTDITENTQL